MIRQDEKRITRTICLRSFYFLQKGLEPTERGCITADPEELNTPQGAEGAFTLTVPDVLQDRREGCDTFA